MRRFAVSALIITAISTPIAIAGIAISNGDLRPATPKEPHHNLLASMLKASEIGLLEESPEALQLSSLLEKNQGNAIEHVGDDLLLMLKTLQTQYPVVITKLTTDLARIDENNLVHFKHRNWQGLADECKQIVTSSLPFVSPVDEFQTYFETAEAGTHSNKTLEHMVAGAYTRLNREIADCDAHLRGIRPPIELAFNLLLRRTGKLLSQIETNSNDCKATAPCHMETLALKQSLAKERRKLDEISITMQSMGKVGVIPKTTFGLLAAYSQASHPSLSRHWTNAPIEFANQSLTSYLKIATKQNKRLAQLAPKTNTLESKRPATDSIDKTKTKLTGIEQTDFELTPIKIAADVIPNVPFSFSRSLDDIRVYSVAGNKLLAKLTRNNVKTLQSTLGKVSLFTLQDIVVTGDVLASDNTLHMAFTSQHQGQTVSGVVQENKALRGTYTLTLNGQ